MATKLSGVYQQRRSCSLRQLGSLVVIIGCSTLFGFYVYHRDDLSPLSFQVASEIFNSQVLVPSEGLTDGGTVSRSVQSSRNLTSHQNNSSKTNASESQQNLTAGTLNLSTRLSNNESRDSLKKSSLNFNVGDKRSGSRLPRNRSQNNPDETGSQNYENKPKEYEGKSAEKLSRTEYNFSVFDLPLAIANRKKKNVSGVEVNASAKPTTWLQLIRLGLQRRDVTYTSNNVIVIPDAVKTPHKISGNATALKKILYWNEFFGHKDFNFGTGQEPFRSAGCPVSSCYATYNKKLFPLKDIDAIIWHGRSNDKSFPRVRYPHTRYVFYMFESPEHTHLKLQRYNKIFNYTMTYRPDSDIYHPYGIFVPLAEPRFDLLTKNYAGNKTKLAAWFVSNCNPPSQRMKVVKYLQKFMQVDIFGQCGNKTCPKVNDHNPDECFQLVEAKYKFYFAFENSLCDHYVTEKFFGPARFDLLPVVYGMGEYKELAPPHSYINVFDFPSLRHLAEYLLYLDRNDTAYSEYFRWKARFKAQMRYRAIVTTDYRSISWCQLCSKLHTDNSVTIYENLDNWRHHYNCIQKDSPLLAKFVVGTNVSQLV